MGQFYFIKGLRSPVQVQKLVQKILLWVDHTMPLCIEARSRDGFETFENVQHISEFGPSLGEVSAREMGRAWVAELSMANLQCTGKSVVESFSYRGISAWWFVEIIFQEPAYLVSRRRQALQKASGKLGTCHSISGDGDLTLPIAASPQLRSLGSVRHRMTQWIRGGGLMFMEWAGMIFRNITQWNSLRRLQSSDILTVIEHENLRRHLDLKSDSIQAVLPYVEGVIESLQQQVGNRYVVLTRRPQNIPFEGWEFLGGALPPLVPKALPIEFEVALQEVSRLSSTMTGDYFNLATLREVLAFRLAEYDLYLDILTRIQPKVLVIYNWEGVFRPLTVAARVSGCRVVGIQQALGPYLHALDHHEFGYYSEVNPLGFAIPDRIAVWGHLHERELRSYGYPAETLTVTGYARLDKHFHVKEQRQYTREAICAQLGLDSQDKYMIFTGQLKVLDTIILRTDHFMSTMHCLCRLAGEFGFKLIMKPWTSDDIELIKEFAQTYCGLVFVASQDVIVSNADLLSISDWVVGTFSSILGEAALAGNACVMLNYPEARYYFDLPHVEHYRKMVPFVDSPELLEKILRPLLESESVRQVAVEKARDALYEIFGPCDGQAANRIVQLVLDEVNAQI